jgi:dihydrofolate synthase / folylpolyglutamate synthase
MTYQETLDFLYKQLPMFTRDGAAAYKLGLGNIVALCNALDNPQNKFKSIHIAGTNGKGSTSHMLASIMQCAGYKVGLYTSPHIKDFRERIRINGAMIAENIIVDFVQKNAELIKKVEPSFFEITVALAFEYFAHQKVDIAIIEVGLGGLYDSTNIILPELCIITNISKDHANLLGDTLQEIATQKAGIIKANIPTVISHTQEDISVVFTQSAAQVGAPLYWADEVFDIIKIASNNTIQQQVKAVDRSAMHITALSLDLLGHYQIPNLKGVLMAYKLLNQMGWNITEPQLKQGLSEVKKTTGLRGRFEIIQQRPTVICDVAHNEDGIAMVLQQVKSFSFNKLHIICGFVADKDISKILQLFPKEAQYYFTQAQITRALPYLQLLEQAEAIGLSGNSFSHINEAYSSALSQAAEDDVVLVVGSFFILSELEVMG